jgi:hypothetical protein
VLNVIGAISDNLKSPSVSVDPEVEKLCNKLRSYEIIIRVSKDCDINTYMSTCEQMLGYICAMFPAFVIFEEELTPVAQLLQQQLVELKAELNQKKYEEMYQRTVQECNVSIECATDLFKQLLKKKHPLEEDYEYAALWYEILYTQVNYVYCSLISKTKILETLINLKRYIKDLQDLPCKEIHELVKIVHKCFTEDFIRDECVAIMDAIGEGRIA